MGGLDLDPCSRSQGVVYNELRLARIGASQGLRHVFHLAVGRPCLLAVYGKGKLPAGGIPFHINRGTVIVLYLNILICACNGRIPGWFHIGDNHGVVLSLDNLHLRFQGSVIQSGSQLAHASSDTVHHLAILISRRCLIPVGCGKRLQAFIA